MVDWQSLPKSATAFLPLGTAPASQRLNSEGAFRLPPTRVEAMYAPELFGETPNALFEVGR